MFDVLVIGGGPAGVTAALRARELGVEVALVERDELGGTCTNDGCAPTRVLARSARLMRDAGHYHEYGLVGDMPRVDLPLLQQRVRETIDALHQKKGMVGHLERAGVKVYLHTGDAAFVDDHTIETASGLRLQGEKIILAAGGRAHRLPFPGSELALTHSDIWSLQSLPPSMVIVGGSATGCQLASVFAEMGSRVTLIDRAVRLLEREDAAVSEAMGEAFLAQGMNLVFGSQQINKLERVGDELVLHYVVEGHERTLAAAAVVMAVGWPGNADRLKVSVAGVETNRGYVIVDRYMQTNVPHIFAAGDINGQMMLVQSASYEARIAAENAVLGVGQQVRHHIVPHGGFTNPEYASVGLTEDQARAVEEDCLVSVVPYTDLDRAVIDSQTVGFCKLIVSQESHRILGAHIVGEQALEAIQLVAAGMVADMWVEQLAELELAYPTYTAVIGLAARRIVQALGVMPMAATWQALGRPLYAEWERSEA